MYAHNAKLAECYDVTSLHIWSCHEHILTITTIFVMQPMYDCLNISVYW